MTIKRSPEISRAIPLEISGNFESFLNLSQAITNDKPAIGKSHAIEYSNTTPNRFSIPRSSVFSASEHHLYYIFIPPQTWITCPVTYLDISEARKVHTSAISSGVPPLLKGILAAHSLRTSSGNCAVISVMINPGATALARIFLDPNSLATLLVKPIIPALEAE